MRDAPTHGLKQKLGLILGPALALFLLIFFDLDPANPLVTRTAAVAVLMAVWWITEAIPIPATALLPVALFPVLGIMTGRTTAATYFNHIIFLFIGGFMMALALERWHLHRRIALRVFLSIGTSPKRIILGFMLATAFLSMWISNTATTMMMVPIALAVITKLKETAGEDKLGRFPVGLLLAIAYAASIGGVATLIGTPPNLSFARIFAIYFPDAPEISFAQWMVFGLPISVVFLSLTWMLLVWLFPSKFGDAQPKITMFREEHRKLGRMSWEERWVAVLFGLMAFLWLTRKSIAVGDSVLPGWSGIFPEASFIDDGTVGISVALLLFLIPSRTKGTNRLMNWATAARLPWGIVLLFGGGFALASGFKESGLSIWVAEQLSGLEGVPTSALIASTCGSLTFLTELTSNTATTEMVLPLLGSLASAIQVNPLLLMIPATLSASCAFMLPVATPPNAIVFGSRMVSMSDMIKAGIVLNLVGVLLITLAMYVLGLPVFDINPGQIPGWAN